MKQTTHKNDEILFDIDSKGGSSLYPTTDLPSLNFATALVDRAGLGEFDLPSLQKKMKGKVVSLSPYISTYSEGMSGSSTPKDLEFFFQVLHAQFTAPRHDPAVRDMIVNETLEQMKMIKVMPQYQFIGELLNIVSQKDPYSATLLNFTEEYVNSVDYERAFQIYKERFANPADFTFTIVGNYDEKVMIDYLETYVASFKTTTTKENFKDVSPTFPEKYLKETVYAGTEDQGSIAMVWSKDFENTAKNKMIINQISEALQIELIEVIREEMSATYSPMLQMDYEVYPKPSYSAMVMINCKPDNTDNLDKAIQDILASFVSKGPKAETLMKVKEQMISARQTSMEKNGFWLSYLSGTYYYGLDINRLSTYDADVNAITNDDIVNFLKANFDLGHHVRVDLNPTTMKK